MHCGLCENKGQSTKCVSEEERKSRDGPPSAYAHVSERSIQQSRAFRHGFSPTAILKIGGKSNAAISSAHCAASWKNRHKRRACRTDAFPDMTTTTTTINDDPRFSAVALLFSRCWRSARDLACRLSGARSSRSRGA